MVKYKRIQKLNKIKIKIKNEKKIEKEKRGQGQLLEGVDCHIYLYCFTFDDIKLNRAFVIIVLFPKKYNNKKVCANDIGKLNPLGFYWYIFFRFNVIINATFFRLKILHSGIWDKIERLKCLAENGFKN